MRYELSDFEWAAGFNQNFAVICEPAHKLIL